MPMATVSEHYGNLLAPIYSWMVGGAEHAFTQGAVDLASWMPSGAVAVDLGTGFGMHTVPLARSGWKVLAIDSSQHLANELRGHAQELAVRTVVADLVDFPQHLATEAQADFILCMGDTLAHLPGWDALNQLARRVASSLSETGRFMATFRDYSVLPLGNARFIPVRSDQNRILTCFLEENPGYVEVHDLL
jgi:2-polyprenyl-3-methyl-5-hydroxy-6-metoxy-1,4-benzoquinol methylase